MNSAKWYSYWESIFVRVGDGAIKSFELIRLHFIKLIHYIVIQLQNIVISVNSKPFRGRVERLDI